MHPSNRIAAARARLAAFRRDDRGGIAIISCAFFMVAIGASALAIDVGSLYLEKRRAQGVTDLAAMAAAGDLAHAEAAARATLIANNVDLSKATVNVVLGHYTPDVGTAVASRFQAGVLPLNAARVTLTKPGQIFFAKTFTEENCCDMTVTGMAANAQLATFSLGSRLAALSGGAINGLLGGLLGGNINLSLMDYNALLSTNVGLFDFAKALAVELNLTGASYNDVLAANATVGNVLNALASVTQANGNTTANAAIKAMQLQSHASTTPINLSKLLSLGPVGTNGSSETPSSNPQISIMDIVSAAATIANGGKMVNVNLGASIPGVASVVLSVAIGEPAQQSGWVAVGQPGATLHTAQMRVRLEAKIGGSGLLSAVQVRLPIYINSATADGTLTNIACAADGTGAVTIAAKPGLASAAIGNVSDAELQNFGAVPPASPAKIVEVSLPPLPLLPPVGVAVYGSASTSVTNTTATNLVFSQTDINTGVIKRASTRNFTQTLVTSLVSGLSVSVTPIGLSITLDPLVRTILAGVTAPLDQVLYTVLTSLGIRLGEVDVRVHGVRCGGGVLAG